MLLWSFFFLQDLIHMQNESLDYFWRQEVLFISVQLSEEVNFKTTIALFVWQFGELDKQHQAEEWELLVLVMEDQKGK